MIFALNLTGTSYIQGHSNLVVSIFWTVLLISVLEDAFTYVLMPMPGYAAKKQALFGMLPYIHSLRNKSRTWCPCASEHTNV